MAVWCRLLSRRLKAADGVERNYGTTIADLNRRLDDLKSSLASAVAEKDDRAERLRAETIRADDRIGRMELLLASLDDLEDRVADRFPADPGDDAEATVLPSFRASRPTGPEVTVR